MSPMHRLVAALTVVHAAVGAWIATSVTGPLLAIDDTAFLALGRTIAGDGAAAIGAQPPYGVLYPALLAPGWLVGLDEAQMVVYGQVLNAVLGALLLPVLYALVRRLPDADERTSLLAAAVGSSLPAALLTGSIVWTERLLPLLIAVGLLAVVRLEERVTAQRLASVVLVAVALFATHPRTAVVVVVLVAAAALFALGVDRLGSAAGVLLAGLVGMRVVESIRSRVADAAFDSAGTYDAADLIDRRGLDDVPHMVIHGGGTIAYLIMATAGLALLGLGVLARHRTIAVVFAAMAAGVVAVAGWFLVGVDRSDAWLHGRYVEILAPPLVALGIVGATRVPWRVGAGVIAGGGVVAGFYGAWAGPGNNWATPRAPVMMRGTEVSGAPWGGTVFEPGRAASTGIVVGLALFAAVRWRVAGGAVIAAVAIGIGVLSGLAALDDLQRRSIVGEVQASPVGEAGVGELAIDTARVPTNVASAVAYEVGLDRAVAEPTDATTHLLLPAAANPPAGAVAIAEFADGVVWELAAEDD